MSTTSHTDMHHEHAAWRLDDNFWRDEIAIWEREVEQVIKDVPRLEKTLRDHAEMLRQHAASIRLYEQEAAYHEHELASYEKGEAPSDLVQLAWSHKHEAEKHAEQYKTHDEIKQRQHVLMTKWRLLFSALVKAEAEEVRPTEKRIQT
ncbi:MAG: hypothetical protein WD738_13205 [Pirellulales bacterium]